METQVRNIRQTKEEQNAKKSVLKKLWSWADDNFHKFKDDTKIRLLVSLGAKDIPQEVLGKDAKNVIYVINGKTVRCGSSTPEQVSPTPEPKDNSGQPGTV